MGIERCTWTWPMRRWRGSGYRFLRIGSIEIWIKWRYS